MKKSFLKKALAIVLSFTMVLPTCIQAFAAKPSDFTDFPTGWSKEAVTAAVANGLLNGRTSTTIEPTGNLTRAELATVINRAFGATITADISQFKDVTPKDWFYNEIAKAVNMQTFQGDGTGTMRPNEPIKREEVFAVIARALVLETSDFSALSAHPDSSEISDWAKPYVAILSQKGYIHGDAKANLNPKANITREEFAQIMHNIIKTYYTDGDTYSKSGSSSSLIRTSGVTLKNVIIEGDLIIGDGVGDGTVVLDGVTIKGRLLARGGEGSVKLVNTTVGDKVVVKDVNGVVNFDNYRSDAPFKGIEEITTATFKSSYNINYGSGGGGSSYYILTVQGAGFDVRESIKPGQNYVLPTPDMAAYAGFVGWKLPDGTIKNAGDTITVTSNTPIKAVYQYKVEHYFETYKGSGSYVIDNSKTQIKNNEAGKTVTAVPLSVGTDGYLYNASHAESVHSGSVSVNGALVLKLYYSSTTYNVTVTGAGYNENTKVNSGERYYLPTPNAASYPGFAGWRKSDGTVASAGEAVEIVSNCDFVAVYQYKVEHYFETYQGSGSYVIDNSKTEIKNDVDSASVAGTPLASGIDGYSYNSSYAGSVPQGVVTVDGSLVLKLYYSSITYNLTVTGAGYNVSTKINAGSNYVLPTPNATLYRGFAGWRMTDGTVVSPGTSVVMVSNRDFVAVYKYKVEHYFETYQGSGSYVIDNTKTEIKNDVISASVTATPLASGIDDYVYNASYAEAVTQGVVTVDGTLVLKLYYNSTIAPTQTFTLNINGAGSNVNEVLTVGSTYTLPVPDSSTYTGFVGWRNQDGDVVNAGTTITILSDYSFVAVYTYKVQHYFETYQGTGSYILDNTKTEIKNDTESASVTATPLASGIDDYVYNASYAEAVTQGVVTVDGSLVLKLYYDSTIPPPVTTYALAISGAGINVSTRVNEGSTYTLPTPDMTNYAGFAGWKKSDGTIIPAGEQITVNGDLSFVAVYNYKIQHYFQSAQGSSVYNLNNSKTVIKTDEANALVTASALNQGIAGYEYNASHANNITQGNVSVDGTLVLKFYYDLIYVPVPANYTIQHWQLIVGQDPSVSSNYALVYTTSVGGNNVGDTVTAPVTNYRGFEYYPALSNIEGTVLANDALVLNIYYNRIMVNVSYDISDGILAPGMVLDEGLKQYGSSITLPGESSVLKDGYVLVGWNVNGEEKDLGANVTIDTDDLTITPVWAQLYQYKIKYYKQNLEKTDFVVDDSLTITRYGLEGDAVSVAASDIVVMTGFTYSESDSELSGTVNDQGSLELKLYYTRNTIDISYSFANGGSFVAGYAPEASVTYGDTITLPSASDVENGFDVFLYWNCNGINYNAGETVTIEDYDPQGGWVFTAVWETTITYTVNFNSLGSTVESYTLPENTSVPQSVFDGLSLWEHSGYVESGSISPVYAGNEYTHKVKFGWYYNPSTNTWEKFTSSTLVTADIVDANGVLTVEERSPELSIYAYIGNIDTGFTFKRYYEPTVVTVDGSGNETITGTRAMDTFKNYLWDAFSSNTTVLQVSLQEQIEKAGDKAFVKLEEKGIIDSDKNILPFELFVRFSQIIGEEELEDYIVDNAKETLKDNDELKDSMLEYFERQANSSNPEDVAEIKSLFKDAIDRAIGSDGAALDMIRDICETRLNDPELIKTAFEDFVDYDVTVTDADLVALARPTIIKWTKDLINTDPSFKEKVKERLVKYITDNIVTSDGFFNDIVQYNFAGTPFEDITKPSASYSTTDLIIDVVRAHFDALTPDEIAVELGYDDLNDLFVSRKANILDVLVDDLNNADFFNHVISTTDFSDYTYADIKNALTLDIIIDFIDNSVDDMTPDELSEFAGYVNSAAMLDAAVTKLGDIIADDIRDTSDSAYGDVLQKFIGQSSVPSGTTSLDLFKQILTKAVADAQISGDYDELEIMTGEDFSAMTSDEINSFFANFNSSLSDTDKLNEYIKAASFNEFDTINHIPSTPREFMARFVEIYFENDSEYALEKLGYTAADIFNKAREYAKDDAKDRVQDPTDSFLVEQIEEHTGYTYSNYASVPQKAFDLVVDVVKHKVNSATAIDDNLAHELGYTDMNSLFLEIEDFILDDVENDIRTDSTERDRYIAEYSGITFADPIEENAMDFIIQYAKAVLDPMTYDEIKNELISLGMTQEEIDEHIEDHINDNIEEIVEDEFGYCPPNIATLTTKQFITEIVLYLFDNDTDKRDAIIDKAIDHLVDSGDLTDFENYVDHAVDYLKETDQLDEIIDDIIETRYRDVLDRMVYQLINEDEFEIESSTSFILTAFEMQVKDYSFDDLIASVPPQIFRLYPREKLEAIYTRAYSELLQDIEAGKEANLNGQTARISSGLNFIINLVDDVYVVFRDRFVELLDDKATANYYYRENKYLRELVRLTSAESLFKTNTGVGTGYAFKDYSDYYNLLMAIVLVGDDAIKWYTDELTKDEFDQLVLNYEDLFVQYADLIADMVGDYADDGELPGKVDNSLVRTVETKIKEKFGDQVNKILNWYEDSSFNREHASAGYTKLRQSVNKTFKTINITTDEVFNLLARGYSLVVNKFDGLAGIEKLDQITPDIYEVTIKGKTIRVERVDDDTYTLSVQGKGITVSRKDNGNAFEIKSGSNVFEIRRAVVE